MNTEGRSTVAWGGPFAIVAAGVVLAAVIFFAQARTHFTQRTPLPSVAGVTVPDAAAETVEVAISADDPVLGSATAGVTVIEFGDFQCPFCQEFHKDTWPQIRQQFIDTGRVKFVFKDFPLSQIHTDAQQASEAAQCAAAQGKFWEYSEHLFAHQSALETEALRAYAETLGLSREEFTTCLASEEPREAVANDVRAALAVGVTATPSFVINGRLYEGALSLPEFVALIEAAEAEHHD